MDIQKREAKNSVVVAIPCYNEAENLPDLFVKFNLLATLHRETFRLVLLVIDDASKDNTKQIVSNFQAKTDWALDLQYVRHPENRGLMGGLRTAVQYFHQYTQEKGPALAYGLMDGDNSHNPLNIPAMLQKILEGYDVVVASRFRPGSRIMGVVWWRQILSAGMALLFKMFKNISGVRDYSCGYRLYSPEVIHRLVQQFGEAVVTEPNFACMVELLQNCDRVGAVMTEVPFLLRYDFKKGESKMRFFQTILGTIRVLNKKVAVRNGV